MDGAEESGRLVWGRDRNVVVPVGSPCRPAGVWVEEAITITVTRGVIITITNTAGGVSPQ